MEKYLCQTEIFKNRSDKFEILCVDCKLNCPKKEIYYLVSGYDRKKHPEKKAFRSITFEEAKKLYSGQTIQMITPEGNAWRNARLNGKVRTWKRDLNRIEIPMKYGMYEYFTLYGEDYKRIIKEIE